MATSARTSPAFVGFAFVGAAAILWGSSAAAVRAFGEETGAAGAVAAFAEAVVAAPLLLVAASLGRRPWPPAGDALPAAAITGGLVSGFLLCYFTAIGLVGVTLSSLVAICSAPMFTAVLAAIFLRERPSPPMLIALVLGVAGTALVLLGQDASGIRGGGGRTGGVLLALTAGFCFGAENVVIRRLMARFDPTQLAAITTCAMIAILAPFGLAAGHVVRSSIDGWPWLLYLAVFPTALAPALHNAGLHRVHATPAAIVGLLEPLTAAVLGLLVFEERIGAAGVGGALLLLAGIAIVSSSQREEEAVAGPAWAPASAGPTELQEREVDHLRGDVALDAAQRPADRDLAPHGGELGEQMAEPDDPADGRRPGHAGGPADRSTVGPNLQRVPPHATRHDRRGSPVDAEADDGLPIELQADQPATGPVGGVRDQRVAADESLLREIDEGAQSDLER
jgi:drug/metabolite transporter, DME family